MTLKENYLNEMSLLKNERIERVVEAAKIEFSLNGIKNSKLRIIAKRAKVGEASIYRYFKDKDELINIVTISYWQNHANIYEDYYYSSVINHNTGLEKVEASLNFFHHLYKNHRKFLKFVEDYNNYYANEQATYDNSSIQEVISILQEKFVTVFNEGKSDGTIKPEFDGIEMYGFVAEVMVIITQKISAIVDSPHSEKPDNPTKWISELIKMFIFYIKN